MLAIAAMHPGRAVSGIQAGGSIERWQLTNLVGGPLLAMMFARPVVDDLRSWIVSFRG